MGTKRHGECQGPRATGGASALLVDGLGVGNYIDEKAGKSRDILRKSGARSEVGAQ